MSFEENLENIIRRVVREELQAASPSSSTWSGCLKLAEAAKLANVSVSTLEKWGTQGLHIMKRGAVRRVEAAELRAFMQQNEREANVEPQEWAKRALSKSSNVTPLRGSR